MALTNTTVITDDKPLVLVTCANRGCGMEYMIPRAFHAVLREHGSKTETWCPAGHRWYYSESDIERANKKVAALESDLAAVRARRDENYRNFERATRTANYWKGIAHRKARRP